MKRLNQLLLILLVIQGTTLAQLLESSENILVVSNPFNAPLLYSRANVRVDFQQAGEFAVTEHYTVELVPRVLKPLIAKG